MNKSFITNLIAALIFTSGYLTQNPVLLNIGLFALSGAITNWIAIHMLFERVPGLYGSGVIPLHFEEFKTGIHSLMMKQFFTKENIERFIESTADDNQPDIHFAHIIDQVDFSPAYTSLVNVIMESKFGSMLGMFGGDKALEPLQEPFLDNLKQSLIDITGSDSFNELVKNELEQPDIIDDITHKVENIIEQRLDELTPQLVKEIIQNMIKQHLGWLVVWGGVFGGIIGFLSTFI